MTRRCSKCKQIKELNEDNFARKNIGKDGFDSRCKACKKAYDKERYAKNADRFRREKIDYYHRKKERMNGAQRNRLSP
jgi:hypothetical protein